MAREIWELAMKNTWWLSAAHCPGMLNVEADEASRSFDDQTEWMLQHDIFKTLCEGRLCTTRYWLICFKVKSTGGMLLCLAAGPRGCVHWPFHVWLEPGKLRISFPPFSVIHMVVHPFATPGAARPRLLWRSYRHLALGEEELLRKAVQDLLGQVAGPLWQDRDRSSRTTFAWSIKLPTKIKRRSLHSQGV